MSERVYVACVIGIAGCGAVSGLGIVALAVAGREVPPSLASLAGTALGYLGGMLARPQANGGPPHTPLIVEGRK